MTPPTNDVSLPFVSEDEIILRINEYQEIVDEWDVHPRRFSCYPDCEVHKIVTVRLDELKVALKQHLYDKFNNAQNLTIMKNKYSHGGRLRNI